MTSLHHIRHEFRLYQLDESNLPPEPFELFGQWLNEAIQSAEVEPTAMVLATATASGIPSARVVLLKSFSDGGFTFFTNNESRKGEEMAKNSAVSLLFFWPLMQRQVRIEGMVDPVSAAESDEYFLSRPEGSRIGAVASPQSREVVSRNELEMMYRESAVKPDSTMRRPDYWGGYRVSPKKIEFWQGRENRLHDRILFALLADASWSISRLAP